MRNLNVIARWHIKGATYSSKRSYSEGRPIVTLDKLDEPYLRPSNLPKSEVQKWRQEVNSLPTVEQKTVELNMPFLYGLNTYLINDESINIAAGNALKFITRTHVEQNFPFHYYGDASQSFESQYPSLEADMKNLLLIHQVPPTESHLSKGKQKDSGPINVGHLFSNLIFLLCQKFGSDVPHLFTGEVQEEARIDNSWQCDNIQPQLSELEAERAKKKALFSLPNSDSQFWDEHNYSGLNDAYQFQVNIRSGLVMRTMDPLPKVVEQSDPLCTMCANPKSIPDPKIFDIPVKRRRFIIVPEFLPGPKCEFGSVFIHTRKGLQQFLHKNHNKHLDIALEHKMIYSAFAQAMSHSFYQGATPFLDPQYPLTQQTIITDGQKWKFGLYQLNRTCLVGHGNSLNNILWCTEDLNLFDVIENNEVKGFNSDTFKLLLQMFLKPPQQQPTYQPQHNYKYLADHRAPSELKKRFMLDVRQLTAQKLSQEPQVHTWEDIYKIQTQRRHKDAKRRFFEIPWRVLPADKVRMDMKNPTYIPRCIRKHKSIRAQPILNSKYLYVHQKYLRGNFKRTDNVYKSFNIKEEPPAADPYLKRPY